MEEIYLDWAATAPVESDILKIMQETNRSFFGNPSSKHSAGRKARRIIEESRNTCADLLAVDPASVFFTSGGTESDAIPLLSLLRKRKGGHIILSSIEHDAVWEFKSLFSDLGFKVSTVEPDREGFIRPDKIRSLLTPETCAAAVMGVNNETGAIQPLAGIGKIIRDFEKKNRISIHFHSDLVQALGKIPLKLKEWDIDSAAFSSHKIGGPRGIGILYLKKSIHALSIGGGQEGGIRPGTENTSAIRGMTAALQNRSELMEAEFRSAEELMSLLIERLNQTDGCTIIPENRMPKDDRFSPYIITFSVAPVPGEVFTRVMNDRGILIGSGSACSANKQRKQSRVLRSMNIPERAARGAVRVSIGHSTERKNIDTFNRIFTEEILRLRSTLRL